MERAAIPKPPKLGAFSLGALKANLGWSDKRFEALRKCTYEASDRFLDTSKHKHEQKPGNWELFLREILSEFIDLDAYDEQWPILVLFERIRKNRVQNLSKATTTISHPDALPRIASEIRFVGKTPPRYCYRKTRSYSSAKAANPRDEHPGSSFPANEHMARPWQAQDSNVMVQPSGSYFNGVATKHNPDNKTSIKESLKQKGSEHPETVVRSERYPVPCMLCSQTPSVPDGANREIQAALGSQGKSVQILAALGILSDHQLRTFRKWGSTEFLDSFPHFISPLYSAVFKKYLISQPDVRDKILMNDVRAGSDAPNTSAQLVKRPSREIEKQLVHHNSPDIALQTAMKLEDDLEGYHSFLRTLEDKINEQWATPTEDDSHGSSFTSLINNVCSEWPRLKTYENHWPARFYVQRRKARGQYSRQSQNNETVERCSPSKSFSSIQNQEPAMERLQDGDPSMTSQGKPWSGCALHAFPKPNELSPKVWAFLQSFGMEEMQPLFMAAKIIDDVSFGLLREGLKTVEERLGAFANLEHFKLNPFQQMMLRVMLKNIDTFVM